VNGGALDPPVDELTAPWWDATRDRRLLLQHCGHCDTVQHYPRWLCTNCGAVDALDWVASSGTGVVDTFTAVHRGPAEGVDVPYLVARVRLDEGPILLTNLVGVAEEDLTLGVAVRVMWRPLADGRNLPVFGLQSEPAATKGI
jgi:uncharacterized OB-fold protein